jgi:hypothetical protein
MKSAESGDWLNLKGAFAMPAKSHYHSRFVLALCRTTGKVQNLYTLFFRMIH